MYLGHVHEPRRSRQTPIQGEPTEVTGSLPGPLLTLETCIGLISIVE
jgi:hypothetical protein